jgi:hypothetical protein
VARDPNLWKWTGKRFKYIGGTQLGGKRHTVYMSPRLVVQFEMDRRGISRVAVGESLQSATRSAVVQRAMPYAIQISPRGDTLEYVSSFRAVDTFTVIAGMRRAACHLLNTSGHAAAVEWISKRGSGHGYGVLRRTLAHLNATSPQAIEHQARAAKFNANLHPRGPGGKFVSRTGAAQTRNRAKNAAAIVKKGPASSRGGP